MSQSRKRRNKKNSFIEDEDDIIKDSDIDLTQKKISSSQFSDTSQMQGYIINLCKYILNNVSSKNAIKKSEILKNVFDGNPKAFPQAFLISRQKLSDVYGYEIYDDKDSKISQFICVSKITGGTKLAYKEDEKKQIALLYIILSYIFMKGGTVDEPSLRKILLFSNIDPEENHHYFGNVKKLISDTFIKQHYLKREKIKEKLQGEDKVNFSWGSRSHREFPKKELLRSIAKNILNKREICFVQQFEEAEQDKGKPIDLTYVEID